MRVCPRGDRGWMARARQALLWSFWSDLKWTAPQSLGLSSLSAYFFSSSVGFFIFFLPPIALLFPLLPHPIWTSPQRVGIFLSLSTGAPEPQKASKTWWCSSVMFTAILLLQCHSAGVITSCSGNKSEQTNRNVPPPISISLVVLWVWDANMYKHYLQTNRWVYLAQKCCFVWCIGRVEFT